MNNLELVAEFEKFLNDKWGYVYGAQGEYYTKELAEKWKREGRNVPSSKWNKETYFTKDCAKWFGHFVADCSGGVVEAIRKYIPKYADRTANGFHSQFTEKGSIESIPEIKGLAVWRNKHIGIYVGNGEVIEFKGTNYGCVKTKLENGTWTEWGKIRDIEYIEEKQYKICNIEMPQIRKNDKCDAVKTLQAMLCHYGYLYADDVNGFFDKNTDKAVRDFQQDNRLSVDGIVGIKSWKKLLLSR